MNFANPLEEQVYELLFQPAERDVSMMKWYTEKDGREAYASRIQYTAKMDIVLRKQLAAADPLRAARLRALLLRLELLQGYTTALIGAETAQQLNDLLTASAGQTRGFQRQWMYDTGAGACCIGRRHLTESERLTIQTIPAMHFQTANGPNQVYRDNLV